MNMMVLFNSACSSQQQVLHIHPDQWIERAEGFVHQQNIREIQTSHGAYFTPGF
jgi:hypothetical protein